jgi:hypothetical protein
MITQTEKQVQIAAKLYEARSAMRSLLGEKYPSRVAVFKDYIRGVMAKTNCDFMTATIQIAKALAADTTKDTGVQQGMIYAACIEISEEK